MRGNVLRVETRFRNCTFQLEGDSHWKCIGRRTHRSSRCHFEMVKDGVAQYCLTQPSRFLQILANLPLVSFLWENPFYFYRDGMRCGSHRFYPSPLIIFQPHREFYFEGDTYILAIHSHGVHSLLKNGDQIAVYKRYGAGNYIALYSDTVRDRPDILILFAAYVEMYQTMDWPWDGNAESFVVLADRWRKRGNWLPEDEIDRIPFLDEDGKLNPYWRGGQSKP